jgi:hypothetical protein
MGPHFVQDFPDSGDVALEPVIARRFVYFAVEEALCNVL